jgi:hypothetical protein
MAIPSSFFYALDHLRLQCWIRRTHQHRTSNRSSIIGSIQSSSRHDAVDDAADQGAGPQGRDGLAVAASGR